MVVSAIFCQKIPFNMTHWIFKHFYVMIMEVVEDLNRLMVLLKCSKIQAALTQTRSF